MTCSVIVMAMDSPNGPYKRGWPIGARQHTLTFTPGAKETLPWFIRVVVSDADCPEVNRFLVDWVIDFRFVVEAQNASGWRFRVEVDPVFISASGTAKSEMKAKMSAWVVRPQLLDGGGGEVVSFSADSIVANIPKPANPADDAAVRAALKSSFSDQFKVLFLNTRYYFAESDVDAVISAGGVVTRTKAQLLALIRDKLDD